ncbi:TPA: hypothetical protein ACOJRH_004605 [Vibrio harveyi]|uniref:hypothetical protein n=1 Tax=Vibrio harveyi TaxID=669 RepID=UPI00028D6D40|nr:hypothetical protein [Vibrio harveyi]EKM16322.1 hypothetical protein VCHENC01_2992 [Vibrio harveyi]MCQ9074869.1 hypothetical protein [Vibrio harveyi]
MSIELNWEKGLPSFVGMYFVAVKLGPAAGVYDFAQWNGSAWELQIEGDIIAYVDIQEFKNSRIQEFLGYQMA